MKNVLFLFLFASLGLTGCEKVNRFAQKALSVVDKMVDDSPAPADDGTPASSAKIDKAVASFAKPHFNRAQEFWQYVMNGQMTEAYDMSSSPFRRELVRIGPDKFRAALTRDGRGQLTLHNCYALQPGTVVVVCLAKYPNREAKLVQMRLTNDEIDALIGRDLQ